MSLKASFIFCLMSSCHRSTRFFVPSANVSSEHKPKDRSAQPAPSCLRLLLSDVLLVFFLPVFGRSETPHLGRSEIAEVGGFCLGFGADPVDLLVLFALLSFLFVLGRCKALRWEVFLPKLCRGSFLHLAWDHSKQNSQCTRARN